MDLPHHWDDPPGRGSSKSGKLVPSVSGTRVEPTALDFKVMTVSTTDRPDRAPRQSQRGLEADDRGRRRGGHRHRARPWTPSSTFSTTRRAAHRSGCEIAKHHRSANGAEWTNRPGETALHRSVLGPEFVGGQS